MDKLLNSIKMNRYLIASIFIAAFVFGINYAGFPHFEGDEGIYTSRAWAFAFEGKLSTETYWYDHPPVGWMFIGFWLRTFGTFFESLIVSSRFFILALNIFNVIFLYKISQKLFTIALSTNNNSATYNTKHLAFFTTILFIFSTMQIYFGRRILIDNIMTFWILASLFTYFYIPQSKIKGFEQINFNIILSALLFGIAALTKENAVLFGIPFVLLIATNSNLINSHKSKFEQNTNNKFLQRFNHQTILNIFVWGTITAAVISLYPVLAFANGEFFPNGYFTTGGKPSLLETLQFQAGRDKSAIFDFNNNPFWNQAKLWLDEDTITFGLGLVATLTNLFLYFTQWRNSNASKNIKVETHHKISGILFLFVLFQMMFFMRGGTVYEFYILPIIPFLILNITFLIVYVIKYLQNYEQIDINKIIKLFSIPLMCLAILLSTFIKGRIPYTENSTKAQLQAINWIQQNAPNGSLIISDAFAKAALYENKNVQVRSQFDAEYNPTFVNSVNNGEQQVNYIIVTNQIKWTLDNLDFVSSLLQRGELVADFEATDWDVQIYEIKN